LDPSLAYLPNKPEDHNEEGEEEEGHGRLAVAAWRSGGERLP
jgi:hypothetical protein